MILGCIIRKKFKKDEIYNGDWGLGIGDWSQSPIPNPQSPIPNPHIILTLKINLI